MLGGQQEAKQSKAVVFKLRFVNHPLLNAAMEGGVRDGERGLR